MSYFNTDMTYSEAQRTLFSVVEGKSVEEINAIKHEYSEVLPVITRKELYEDDGWLTEHPLKPQGGHSE